MKQQCVVRIGLKKNKTHRQSRQSDSARCQAGGRRGEHGGHGGKESGKVVTGVCAAHRAGTELGEGGEGGNAEANA